MKDTKYIVKDNVIVNHNCLHCKKKKCRISYCCRISVQQRPIQLNRATTFLRSCSVTYLLCIGQPIC